MHDAVRITVVVDDTAGSGGLLAEHGLALWVEAGDLRVLFDTGQGAVLQRNARRLRIRPEHADAVVLSHGHYDHTGGLRAVLKPGGRTPVYLHPAALEPKFVRNDRGSGRPIGMADADRRLVTGTRTIVHTEKPVTVGERLNLTGPIPRTTDFEDTGGPFFRDAACADPDPLVDDQAAFLNTRDGLVVVLGCAHAGIVNTLRYIARLTDGEPVDTVVGGMHLLQAAPERMAATIAALDELGVRRFAPCHCTGFEPTARMWQKFGPKVTPARSGTTLTWK